MQFMTIEWLEAYGEILNKDEIIAKKLRKFSSAFLYAVNDKQDTESLVMKIEKGVCVECATLSNSTAKKIEFEISADTQSWKQLFNHELSIKQIISSDGFKFKAPKLKALSNKTGLERSVRLLLQMENVLVA